MPDYYSLLTTTGAAKIANAIATNTTITLEQVALGDGNGADVTPTVSTAALVNEVYRANVNSCLVNPQNTHWINIDLAIPAGVGGWTIREFLILDNDDDVIFVGNLDAQPKPLLPTGTAIDLFLRFIVEVSETSAINMVIDPNLITATQGWVISYVESYPHNDLYGLQGGDADERYHLLQSELNRVQAPVFLSKAVIDANYSIPTGYNAGSVETTIADGVTVTIPNNSIWQVF